MGTHAFNLSVEFYQITCANCGVSFGVPAMFDSKRRENHANFYCPSGHVNYYPAETEAEQLRRELGAEKTRHQATLARLNTTERRAKKAERQIKRVTRGVCPCCNRTFENLARHMQTKHPEQASG